MNKKKTGKVDSNAIVKDFKNYANEKGVIKEGKRDGFNLLDGYVKMGKKIGIDIYTDVYLILLPRYL
jgi:hypothetical protein